MTIDSSFLVEDFLGAIASQLDRTQDALALKAVNRPLTYAIKDFTMELRVFVDLDPEGKVRFRSPGANEPGASVVNVGFTTITRPMIQENTVDVAMNRSPTLEEAGLPEADRQRLERVGVRNTAELKNLGGSAGAAGLSRLSGIPVDRLRAAISFGRPLVGGVRPVAPAPVARQRPPIPAQRTPVSPVPPRSRVVVPPATKRLELVGRNLLGGGRQPDIRLAGRPLAVAEADDVHLLIDLPDDVPAVGALEVDHGDGDVSVYELAAADPWAPGA